MPGLHIEQTPFGAARDGTAVALYTLTNGAGMAVAITTYGGIVVSLRVPDRAGRVDDVVLGYSTLEGYLADNRPYFGALVGRYANRIARGELTIEGATYALPRNEGAHHLHGGPAGFDKAVWAGRPVRDRDRVGVELSRLSKDGEEGYPGNLSVKVTYALTDASELAIDYVATTDRATVCNLTHHGYFNLDGTVRDDVVGHLLTINARRFTPVDPSLIPTGELRAVGGTPMDFTQPTAIGARIAADDEQVIFGRGYDHNWVLDRAGGELFLAATLLGPETGRVMEVLTTEPGLQFYSGNFLDGTISGKGSKVYGRRAGLCLETQHYPDSPHHPCFPSTLLSPGETYRTTTIYRFSVAG